MVSISKTTLGFILGDIHKVLEDKLQTVPENSIEYAFAAWLYPLSKRDAILPEDFSVMDYSHVAQLGYLTDLDPDRFNRLNQQLVEGLDRVIGRPVHATGPSAGNFSFYNDAIAMLGLALGADIIGGEKKAAFHAWLRKIVALDPNNIEWRQILFQAALWKTDTSTVISNKFSNEASDILLALETRGINCFQELDLDTVYQVICTGMVYQELDIVHVVSKLVSIHYLSNHLPAVSLSHPTVDQVIVLLNNINSSFKRWVWEDKGKTSTSIPQRWDILNEYHVQSLLYFLLSPLFPDIESEFYSEPVGQLNSRADIGLPSLNLIIEVKFLRRGKKFQKMIEEVAADNSLYFKKDSVFRSKYSRMLVFLWDDTRRNEEHQLFINGVNGLENIVGTVVVSRPGMLENLD